MKFRCLLPFSFPNTNLGLLGVYEKAQREFHVLPLNQQSGWFTVLFAWYLSTAHLQSLAISCLFHIQGHPHACSSFPFLFLQLQKKRSTSISRLGYRFHYLHITFSKQHLHSFSCGGFHAEGPSCKYMQSYFIVL